MACRPAGDESMNNDIRELWQINKYLWMSLGFVLVYLVVAEMQGLVSAPLWSAWLLFAMAIFEGASRSYFAYRRGGTLDRGWAWFYTYIDIALISVAVGITRGLDSDLWLLYFVVLIFESLYQTPRAKHILDVSIIVAYLLATLPFQLLTVPQPMPWSVFTRVFVSRLFFLILVSALGRRISSNAAERSRELLLLREQMATAEERARIAREIHDGLGHALVSTILRLELCARLIRTSPDEAEAMLKEEIPALRAAWNEGRDLAFHLRPWETDAPEEASLAETLRRHIGRFAERTGASVTLRVEGGGNPMSQAAMFGLTRIVQEALTNAVKHAHATAIEVTLTDSPQGGLACAIADNGKGFAVDAPGAGVGLQAMRERAETLGGAFAIESAPGSGTKITVVLSDRVNRD
jgi:signal transduction histidine kinase